MQQIFASQSGLTQHANAVHHGRRSLRTYENIQQQFEQSQEMSRPVHDANIWNMPITLPPPPETIPTYFSISAENLTSQDDDDEMDDIVFEESPKDKLDIVSSDSSANKNKPRYNLRSHAQNIELDDDRENDERSSDEENDEELQSSLHLKDNDFDLEDLQGASLDDALDTIEGKNKPEHIAKYPNDVYRDFMELIVEGNISNKIGDKIIKFFNNYSNLEKSPLPSSTKSGKDYLNQINSPSLDFKEKVVATYSGVDFKLYYRPIFRAVQALVQRPEVADKFVHKGVLKYCQDSGERIFGEPYECDWWLETEKTLPPLNHLLSIILYSDATTFDGLGKTSGHPVFLTLGNLPNLVRNLPESKILLGFLPKIQDSGIKTTDSFRSFQREIFHKCFNIMLQPLLRKPDTLYFGIKGRQMTFAARISFFLADMLEADEITVTYKSARCKMPCHTCMVFRDELNKMDFTSAPLLRTHANMQQVIKDGQEKDHSVHSTENAFWKFP